MAKMKSKGTVLLKSIASVYTAIPQIVSISKSGEKSETYDSRTLDGAAALTHDPTGYYEVPTIKAELFYDAANAVHAGIKTDIRTPANFPVNYKLTYTDAGPVSEIWSVNGAGLDETIEGTKGVMASLELQTSGAPS